MGRTVLLCRQARAFLLEQSAQWRIQQSSSNAGCIHMLQACFTTMHHAGTKGMSRYPIISKVSCSGGWARIAAWAASTTAAAHGQQLQHAGHRSYTEGDLRVVHAEITEHEYHKLADEALDKLQEKLEIFIEDLDIAGGDVEQAQGVLTVKLGSHGTYVINKQTPNRQIWLSSPLTGPFRYDYHDTKWVYSRTGQELFSQLQQELHQLLGSTPYLTEV